MSLGLRYMVASTFFFSLMSVLVKLGGEYGFQSAQLVFARALIALILSSWALRRARIAFWHTPHRKLLLLRGVLGFGGLSCFYYAVTALPLADATVIQYLNPLCVTLLAAWFLKERFERGVMLGLALSVLGVVLIAQPSFLFGSSRLDPFAAAVALLGAVMSAGAYTTVRALRGKAEPMLVVFYFPLVATPLSWPAAWPVWIWPDEVGWALLLGIGVVTQIAQVLMTRGLHLEAAAKASSITYLQVVFAFGWGMALFGELPSLLSLLGTACVLAGALVVMLQRSSAA